MKKLIASIISSRRTILSSLLLCAATSSSTAQPLRQFAENRNEEEVAIALDRQRGRGGYTTVLNDLDSLSPGRIRFSLDRIAPTEIAAVSTMTFATTNSVLAVLDTRLSSMHYLRREQTVESAPVYDGKTVVSDGKTVVDKAGPIVETYIPRWTVWAQGSGLWGFGKRYQGLQPYDWFNNTDLIGVDYWIADNLFVGGFAGYSGSWLDFRDDSKIDSNSARFGAYASWKSGGAYVTGIAYGGYTWYDWERRIRFPGVNRTGDGDPEGYDAGVNVTGGYDINAGGFIFGPFGGLGYTHFNMQGFHERGAGNIGVRFSEWNTDSLRSTVGLHLGYPINLGGAYPILMPDVRVSWQHEFLDGTQGINARFRGRRQPRFEVRTPDSDEESLLVTAGVNAQITETVGAYVYYAGDLLREDRFANSVTAGLTFSF